MALRHIYNVGVSQLTFQWDEVKNRENRRKHGVSFEEARTVFYDERAMEFYDVGHSDEEDRFLMLGLSARLRILMVCHCVREAGNVIRLISARKATKKEISHYPRGDV